MSFSHRWHPMQHPICTAKGAFIQGGHHGDRRCASSRTSTASILQGFDHRVCARARTCSIRPGVAESAHLRPQAPLGRGAASSSSSDPGSPYSHIPACAPRASLSASPSASSTSATPSAAAWAAACTVRGSTTEWRQGTATFWYLQEDVARHNVDLGAAKSSVHPTNGVSGEFHCIRKKPDEHRRPWCSDRDAGMVAHRNAGIIGMIRWQPQRDDIMHASLRTVLRQCRRESL